MTNNQSHRALIDATAKAISGSLGHDWPDASQGVREICEDAAKAALAVVYEALKEPSDDMVESAREHHEGEAYLPYSLWQAMLSASAIGEGETPLVDNENNGGND